jgi:hypothetical protein
MKDAENFDSVRSFGFRAPRVSTGFSFSLEVTATGQRYEGECTDISEDGLAADLLIPLAPMTQVTMRLLLPGGTRALQTEGSVEYGEGRRCGLNFSYASVDEHRQIQKFVRSIS